MPAVSGPLRERTPSHGGQAPWRVPRSVLAAIVSIAALALLLLAGGCGSTSTPSGDSGVVADPTIGKAVDQGVAFLRVNDEVIDPLHLATLDYLYRNWGIDGLADAGDLADEVLAEVAAGAPWTHDYGDTNQILDLRRLVDPSWRQPPPGPIEPPGFALMAAALYCDVQPLDADDLALWDEEVERGGYLATHVLLAWSWTQALGCDDPAIGQAGRRAEAAVRAEFIELTASGAATEIVTDLTLEQAAFLAEVGAEDVLTDQWVDAVVAAQGPDGGWDLNGAGSHWHPTLLAVWVLSAASGPGSEQTWARP